MSVKREKKLVDLFRFCEKQGLEFEMTPSINQVWIRDFNRNGLCLHIDTRLVAVGNFGLESGTSVEDVLSKLKQLTPLWKKLKQIESN